MGIRFQLRELVNGKAEKRKAWLVSAKAVDDSEVLCELCDVTVVNFSEFFGDGCTEPVSRST